MSEPELELRHSSDGNGGQRKNLGDCRNISWGHMRQRFHEAYGYAYQPWELNRIHHNWRRLAAEIGWK